jgi:hypothetical protein
MSQYKAIVAAIFVLCFGLVTAHTTEEPPAHQAGFGTAYTDENPMPPLSLINQILPVSRGYYNPGNIKVVETK